MGSLALFIALGGTSYAVARGSIGSRAIKNNSVQSKDIRNNTIRSKDVRNGTLLGKDFKAGQLPAGPRGPEGPQGPAGTTDTYTRSNPGEVVSASGGIGEASVYCDEGDRAVGGGLSVRTGSFAAGSQYARIFESSHDVAGIPPREGWTGQYAQGNTGTTLQYDATVVCARP